MMAMSTQAAVFEAVEQDLHSVSIRQLAATRLLGPRNSGMRHASLGNQRSFLVKVVIGFPKTGSATSKEAAQLVQSFFDPLCKSLPA
jgi:hypothetical protein